MKLTLAELENRISILEDEIARITDIETRLTNIENNFYSEKSIRLCKLKNPK